MDKLIVALILSLFAPSGNRAAGPAEVQPPPDPVAIALSRPAVGAEAAGAARAEVKHTRAPSANGGEEHRFVFGDGPGAKTVEFSTRAKRPRDQALRERVIGYVGTEAASKEPASTFDAAGKAAGLSPEAITALRFVYRHEGGFDAINTWDRARFSWGFIQFAGGYGFPPALAHLKSASPDLFHQLLGRFGVDILPGADGRPQPVYVDSRSGMTLLGAEAEQAFGDDPLVIALFIRAGRVTEVKQRQVEAAIRNYVLPGLAATYQNVKLSQVLRSPQSLAMLIDRQVHEGNVGRLGWALEHAWIVANAPDPAAWRRLEGSVLELAVRDADARANIAELAETSAVALARAAAALRTGGADAAAGSTALAAARTAMLAALTEADYRMVVSYRRDEIHNGFISALAATDPGRVAAGEPATMAGELDSIAGSVRELVARFRFEYAVRNRLRGIRASGPLGPA